MSGNPAAELCLAIPNVLEIDEQGGHLPTQNLSVAKQSPVTSLHHVRFSVGEGGVQVGVAAGRKAVVQEKWPWQRHLLSEGKDWGLTQPKLILLLGWARSSGPQLGSFIHFTPFSSSGK